MFISFLAHNCCPHFVGPKCDIEISDVVFEKHQPTSHSLYVEQIIPNHLSLISNIPKRNLKTQNTLLKSTEEKEDQVILACLKGEKSSYLFLLESTNKKGFLQCLAWLMSFILFLAKGKTPISYSKQGSFKIFIYNSPNILQQS